jgi:hypothetical protein
VRLTLVAGVLLLVLPPLAWWVSVPPDAVGADPAAPVASEPGEDQHAPDAPALRWGGDDEVPPDPASAGGDPTRLTISAIGVDHPIVAVGRSPDGAMEVPDDVHEIGWYAPMGVRPGDPGSAVLAGHVDSRRQGRGAFFDLRSLEVGDVIVVETVAGEQRWVVTGRTRYPKAELPVDDLFAVTGGARLVLITCGGDFDPGRRSYRDNVVVAAAPVAAVGDG